MEKKTIIIKKIRSHELFEKPDEVAVEHQVCITLRDGREILVSCTPSHVDELILGRRYLVGDLAEQELKAYGMEKLCELGGDMEKFSSATIEEIFRIARDSFENPGSLFNDTGCAHSCALIYEGKVICCMEDVGRHNALDKVVGYALMHKIPFSQSYIFTSGRISEDYLQKVINAGFPMAVSRAAVTANAVELAKEKNITLLGFIRKNTGNLYWEGAIKIKSNVEMESCVCETKPVQSKYEINYEKTDRKDRYSLLLLAGGKSSRMGQNKAELLYEGKTFTELLISKAEKLGIEKIYVSGYQGERKDVQVVWDIYPDRGPLGGIHACMKQMQTPFCLVLPVDVPQIPLEVLEQILEFHERINVGKLAEQLPILLEHNGHKEYLIGVYPVQVVDFIEELIQERPASVHGMLRAWGANYCKIDVPEWQVENVNTQEAYQNLLKTRR